MLHNGRVEATGADAGGLRKACAGALALWRWPRPRRLGQAPAWQPASARRVATRPSQPVAVFGSDDRIRCPPNTRTCRRRSACCSIMRSRTVCTAFCVRHGRRRHRRPLPASAPPASGRPRLADFWFARNYDAVRDYARIAGHASGAAAQHVMSGALSLNVRPPIDATRDWALVRLARPVCAKGVLPAARAADRADPERGRRQARVPGLLSSRLHALEARLLASPAAWRRASRRRTGSSIARDFAEPAALLLHTCDTGGRLVGLAAAARHARRTRGDRHQRRHLRAVQGADAGRAR